jgi:ferric-dicitrate binding protein FerR (iron transport regulator)
MKTNKYLEYKAIDFLKDEDFLRWNMFNLEEDRAYWEDVTGKYPQLGPVVDEAAALFRAEIRFNDYKLSDAQIDSTYEAVKSKQKALQNKRRTMYYWLSGVASVFVAVLAIALYISLQSHDSDSELLSYLSDAQFDESTSADDVQIQMSTDTLITFEEKMVEISYEEDSIKAVGKSIASTVNETDFNRLVVPKGKRSKLTLSDGTTLHVNSGSSVVYPNKFTSNVREIYVDGEVFLDVAHNNNQPFIVRTKDLAVKVLGTKFNVQSYEEDTQTSVVLSSGSVKVRANSSSQDVTLKPSQMYDYNGGSYSVKTVDVYRYISWMDGILFVNDEGLDILFNKLSRYYGVDIEYDEDLRSEICSGKVDLKDDLGEVLDGLTFSFPIGVEKIDDTYKITIKDRK